MRRTISTQGRFFLLAVLLGLGGYLALRGQCWTARLRWGIAVRECPDGTPRQTVTVASAPLLRGREGLVRAAAWASYTTGPSTQALQAAVGRGTASFALVGAGKEWPLVPREPPVRQGDEIRAKLALPADVPDGDHKLRVTMATPLATTVHEAPLPLYAPARVHVLTDRPLYKPGDTMRFRALALRAKDLAPLEHRPGRFVVEDPNGEVVLEERAAAGPWGVAAGSFPLDAGAPEGTWKVRWVSGAASEAVSVRVEPFRLPRLKIDASAAQPFYRAGQRPLLRGAVAYASGAPVSGARIEVRWTAHGEWPPPRDWLAKTLPQAATADANGRFTLELPAIPPDLTGQATLNARIAATDPAGERVETSAPVLLAQDAIQVAVVTELAAGLVDGFNNRVYLRATMADGTPLPKAELLVRRAWDAEDKGVVAAADEDGVASLQLDPGPPVNVIVPAKVIRPRPPPPVVALAGGRELIRDRDLPLADRRRIEEQLSAFKPCATHVAETATVKLALRVDAAGKVVAAVAGKDAADQCATKAASAIKLGAGNDRLMMIQLAISGTRLPRLSVEATTAPAEASTLDEAVRRAAFAARTCLPGGTYPLPRLLHVRLTAKSKAVAASFAPDPQAAVKAPAAAAPCLEKALARIELDEPAEASTLGVVRFSVEPAASEVHEAARPTTFLGYELVVSARRGGKELGSTRLRVRPGAIPALRLRATPVLASAGGTLEIDAIRGPSFRGDLPKKLELTVEGKKPFEVDLDPKTRKAKLTLPEDAAGWIQARLGEARALAYVRPASRLQVEVGSDRPRYAPGDTATVRVHTAAGGKGARAAVGLFGVDESLGQLASLAGPDELARLRPGATMRERAFGVLDAQALAMGRLRGANAATATILQVAQVPQPSELDAAVAVDSRSTFDPNDALTDGFYAVLGELQQRVRAWEEKAPEADRMQPAIVARLWDEAVAALDKRGTPARDAYGRKLRLSQLPSPLLELADPRALVVSGARLPEDVESWTAFVAKEQP